MPEPVDLRTLLARDTPFIDLRSPVEFADGTLPNATNLPLLTNEERHQVGSTYQNRGQAAALALGHELVAGAVREARVAGWRDWLVDHPRGWLYCWRGGLRSEIAQQWLAGIGIEVPRVPGGYKALRQCCLNVLADAPGERPWLVLGGRTGSGKTRLIRTLPGTIDLEGLANHRGSAFGAQLTPQPTPITFECRLAAEYLKLTSAGLIVEDESRTIGRLALPGEWHAEMQRAPVILLEVDLPRRARNIEAEYVLEPLAAGVAASTLFERYRASLDRIQKRLGGQRKKEVEALLVRGFAAGDHTPWIERLLAWYYDPMYDYQLDRKADRIRCRGDAVLLTKFVVEEFLAAAQ